MLLVTLLIHNCHLTFGSNASVPGGLVRTGTLGLGNRAGGVRYRSTEYRRLLGVRCSALLGGAPAKEAHVSDVLLLVEGDWLGRAYEDRTPMIIEKLGDRQLDSELSPVEFASVCHEMAGWPDPVELEEAHERLSVAIGRWDLDRLLGV